MVENNYFNKVTLVNAVCQVGRRDKNTEELLKDALHCLFSASQDQFNQWWEAFIEFENNHRGKE